MMKFIGANDFNPKMSQISIVAKKKIVFSMVYQYVLNCISFLLQTKSWFLYEFESNYVMQMVFKDIVQNLEEFMI